VAQRIREVEPRAERTRFEHLQVRLPWIYTGLAPLAMRLRPRSVLRRFLNRNELRSGWSAASRHDYDLMTLRYAPEMVYEFTPELITLGMPARVEGRDRWLEALNEFGDAWESWTFRPRHQIDLDGRVVNLGLVRYRGEASGAEVEMEYAQVVNVPRGAVTHECDFNDWRAALRGGGPGRGAGRAPGGPAPGRPAEALNRATPSSPARR
jgi:ketosteroid isomerase-like protein